MFVSFFLAYGKIRGLLNPTAKKEFQALLGRVREEKQDEDVLYYASKCEE